ncbi:MAG TPA: hypothetical protein VN421_03320 [Pseudoflavonifractor sp.]|nr:hypothetical protein [Pseudoflavonifractor sp.]
MIINVFKTRDQSAIEFGFPAHYHFNEPATTAWTCEVQISLPDGFEVAEAADGNSYVYSSTGEQHEIVEHFARISLVSASGIIPIEEVPA